MTTIRDVARLAGVSVATVSRVLNDSASASKQARERVLSAVSQLGYRPNANAQALANQSSDTIGVVVMDVSDPFFGALVKAVDDVAQRHRKNVLITLRAMIIRTEDWVRMLLRFIRLKKVGS